MTFVLKNDEFQFMNQFIAMKYDTNNNSLALELYNRIVTSEQFDLANFQVIATKTIDLNKLFIQQTLFGIGIDHHAISDALNMTNIANSRDMLIPLSMLKSTQNSLDLMIYFADKATDFLVVSYMPTQFEGNYQLENYDEPLHQTILRYYPEIGNIFDMRIARRGMVMALDPNDSIASLEAQLDILTKIVTALVDQFPDAKNYIINKIPQYNTFTEMIDRTSVLNVKHSDKCLEDIAAKKEQVRSLQQQYYAVKNKR